MREIKTRAARTRFLDHLALTGNVTQSAKAAGFSAQYAYSTRARDAEFALAWQRAEDDAIEGLLAEARRRAVDGVEQPVVYGGKLVRRDDGSENFSLFLSCCSVCLMSCAAPVPPPLVVHEVQMAKIPKDLLSCGDAPEPPANATNGMLADFMIDLWQWGFACHNRLDAIAPLVVAE